MKIPKKEPPHMTLHHVLTLLGINDELMIRDIKELINGQ